MNITVNTCILCVYKDILYRLCMFNSYIFILYKMFLVLIYLYDIVK